VLTFVGSSFSDATFSGKDHILRENTQSINIRLLRHDKMPANKLKDKHDKTKNRK